LKDRRVLTTARPFKLKRQPNESSSGTSQPAAYAAFGALLSWSFTTLAVAAKNVMTSVPNYIGIETAFTAVQWIMVGPLTALAFARVPRKSAAITG
jgi:hypothetical protein